MNVLFGEFQLPRENLLAIRRIRIWSSGEDGLLIAESDRRGIGEARPDREHPVPSVPMHLGPFRDLRPWADEAHLADQDVPELREFVQLGPAEKASDAGHPGSVARVE